MAKDNKKPDNKKEPDKKPDDKKSAAEKDKDDLKTRVADLEKEGRENGTKEYNRVYPAIRVGGSWILGVITILWITGWIVSFVVGEKSPTDVPVPKQQQEQHQQQEDTSWPEP